MVSQALSVVMVEATAVVLLVGVSTYAQVRESWEYLRRREQKKTRFHCGENAAIYIHNTKHTGGQHSPAAS